MNEQGEQSEYDQQLRIAEHNSLRQEILSHIEAIRSIETETVIGIGAISAWLLSTNLEEKIIYSLGAFIPVILTVANMGRVRDRQQRIRRIAAYIRALEDCTLKKINVTTYVDEALSDEWTLYHKNECATEQTLVTGWEEFIAEVRHRDKSVSSEVSQQYNAHGTADSSRSRKRTSYTHKQAKRPVIIESYHKLFWPSLILMSFFLALILAFQ